VDITRARKHWSLRARQAYVMAGPSTSFLVSIADEICHARHEAGA